MPDPAHPPTVAFSLLAQRSERARIRLVIGVLVTIVLICTVRRWAGGLVMTSEVYGWTLGLLGAAIGYEAWVHFAVSRAIRANRLINELRWRLNAAIEVSVALGILVILHIFSPRGEIAALSAPSLLLLPLVVLLSVLRLRPAFTLWTGLSLAAGHAVLAVLSFVGSGAAFPMLPVLLSYAVMLALTALGGWLVATRVRGYVLAAVHEESERKRVQLVARNTLIFGLAKLAEYRDTDTGSHLERISVYCGLLARELGRQGPADSSIDRPTIDDDWVQTLCVASSMHDIGKVGIPDAVLCKPGRLDDNERLVIQRHPALGRNVLTEILQRNGGDQLLEMSAQIAACHHERWDGAGYPERLAGNLIPLPARIVAVADVYDALTSPRVYKPAMEHSAAVAHISAAAGTQFDPAVVAAFLRVAPAFDKARSELADKAEQRAA